MNTTEIILIPEVKERKLHQGNVTIEKFVFGGPLEEETFARDYLNVFLKDSPCEINDKNANVRLVIDESLNEGAYRLSIQEFIVIKYREKQGIRNALATLLQLMEITQENHFVLKRQEINDFPDCKLRSVLIDLARGLPDFERLKEDVRRLSLLKCTHVHLHLMDTMGICYESDVLKITDNIRETKLYSKAQMKELVTYCQKLGIEIIPEFEIPAHAHALTEYYKNLACKTQEETPSPAVVCAGSEETYQFYADLIAEFADIFPCKYLHMGGDELYFNDFPSWNYHPNWESCSVCKDVMTRENLQGIEELYYYVVRRINELAKAHGKTLILFNDQLNVAKPLPLPKDIIVQFWRVSNKNRGPRKDCSYQKFFEQGFQVICSPFEYCYVDIEEFANPEKTAYFDFNNYQNTEKYKNFVLGGECCAWEYGNPAYPHYHFSFTSSAGLLTAKMWNAKGVVYDKAYRVAFSRLILGHYTPKSYDIFDLFASIMPPRLSDKVSYAKPDNELLDEEILEAQEIAIESISFTYSSVYLKNLKELIKKLKGEYKC